MDNLIEKHQLPFHSPKKAIIKNRIQSCKSFLIRNQSRIEFFKQSLFLDCLARAKAAGDAITDDKLNASSAAQLANIARESVYTSEMLRTGLIPVAGNKTVNVMQIILEQPVNPQSSAVNNPDIKKALEIQAEVVKEDLK